MLFGGSDLKIKNEEVDNLVSDYNNGSDILGTALHADHLSSQYGEDA